ncbi:MAG TPA: alpha/beta hydrolase [Acidimicrobiales bacterium]|nr:alpha/beta hydrolase [Acidimicrobiales bacterium]
MSAGPDRASATPGPVTVTASTLDLAGTSIEVLDAAPRPDMAGAAPLVLLHEGLGSARLWRSFPWDVAAATGRRTVAYSRPGYGSSSVVTAPRTPRYMHDEAIHVLPAVLRGLGIERPVLVGHSDGASIALIHAGAAHPVTAVVAIAAHVLVEERSLEGIRAARHRFETTDLGARMGRHHRDPVATFRGWNDIWLSEEFRDWNIERSLPAITAPVLVVQAADDEYGTTDQVRRIAEGVAGPAQTLVLPGGGHAPHLTRSDEVCAAVTRFLADLP